MWQSARLRRVASSIGAAALVALGGCYAETGSEPAYVQASAAPVDVDAAPRYSYEGRPVYYVNDRWYARDRGNWVYYRSEPETLYRYRTHIAAAPAARAHRRRQEPTRHEIASPRREAANDARVQ